MSSPYKGEGRGIAMLNLLRTLSQSIAPSMADMWEQEIPLLVQYLEGEVPLCVHAGGLTSHVPRITGIWGLVT